MKVNIGSMMARRADLTGSREAYVDSMSGERLTYNEMNARCNRLANALRGGGVKKGDRVALALMNSAEFI